MRSAGEESESAATRWPASSRTAAATQRTPISASSLSVAQPWRWMRSSSRSSCGALVSVFLVCAASPVRLAYSRSLREALFQQEQLAGGGDVQRGARADDVHHAHRRAARGGALDVDDLVVVAHREVHGLARLRVQLAHHRQRQLAHADARLAPGCRARAAACRAGSCPARRGRPCGRRPSPRGCGAPWTDAARCTARPASSPAAPDARRARRAASSSASMTWIGFFCSFLADGHGAGIVSHDVKH